jgi:hypothetical protein
VPARSAFDYAVVRVVPRVEREEFVNAGVILHAPARAYIGCEISLPRARLRGLAPDLSEPDVDEVMRHLDAWRAVCAGDAAAGPIGRLSPSERFHWLVAPRSTILQTSAVHAGVTDDPPSTLQRLFRTLVAAGVRGREGDA